MAASPQCLSTGALSVRAQGHGCLSLDFKGELLGALQPNLGRTLRAGLAESLLKSLPSEHPSQRELSPALRSNEICPARFWTYLGPVTPFSFLIFPLWDGNVYSIHVPPLYFLKQHNLFVFIGSQLEGNSSQDELYLEYLPYLI